MPRFFFSSVEMRVLQPWSFAISASYVAYKDSHLCAQLLVNRGSLEFFCPDWPWTSILPISVSWIAMITDLSHRCLPSKIFEYLGVCLLAWDQPFLPSRCVAVYPYTPRKEDELELRKGEMFLVFERCQDGWFKGTSMHTSKIGVFPGNYVAPVTRYGFEWIVY
jgi:hypothetical protein